MSTGPEQAERLGGLVRSYRGGPARRPLGAMTFAVIVFVVLCTMWGDYSSDGGFLTAFAVVIVVMAVCVTLIVRNVRTWVHLYEEGFRIERPGRRPLDLAWREIASVGTQRTRVFTNFSHSHDVLKTVFVPYAGKRIRFRAMDFFVVTPGRSLWRSQATAEGFVDVATRRVGADRAARYLAELRDGGEVHVGPLVFTPSGLTVTPFTDVVPWSRFRLVEAGPQEGVRLRVAGLAELVGSTALSSRAAKAGYSTKGDLLTVWDLMHRPGTDYVALRILLAQAPGLPA
ncbi:hypothetical protein ACYF6T_37870 [Streptomyces sp. 7R007]